MTRNTAGGTLPRTRDRTHDAELAARTHLISSRMLSLPPHRGRVSGLTSPLPQLAARRLLEYISNNIALSLRIAELANAVMLSRSHFSRVFVLTFGTTPHRFIMDLRIAVAQDLLKNTDQALSDIAIECGFADQAHFSRVFASLRGVAPGMWRRGARMAGTTVVV